MTTTISDPTMPHTAQTSPAEGRLLLVDDDPDFRNMTARNFRHRGYEVEEADCGESIRHICRRYRTLWV